VREARGCLQLVGAYNTARYGGDGVTAMLESIRRVVLAYARDGTRTIASVVPEIA